MILYDWLPAFFFEKLCETFLSIAKQCLKTNHKNHINQRQKKNTLSPF
jgi:hypothetical protein